MFEDQFSRQASEYARYRPGYPDELFEWLSGVAPGNRLAWDCGTGNGQAAIGLANRFEQVIATDASSVQIAHAKEHPRVSYRVAPAEDSGIPSGTVDLVTVAQAAHWFEFDRFYAEVGRVLRPGGVIAVWTYNVTHVTPEIDALIGQIYFEILGPYWSPRIEYVNSLYRTLPFPFEEIEAPQFELTAFWRQEDLIGYISSWSATQRYMAEQGIHPIEEIRGELDRAWGNPTDMRRVLWPLSMRVGKVG